MIGVDVFKSMGENLGEKYRRYRDRALEHLSSSEQDSEIDLENLNSYLGHKGVVSYEDLRNTFPEILERDDPQKVLEKFIEDEDIEVYFKNSESLLKIKGVLDVDLSDFSSSKMEKEEFNEALSILAEEPNKFTARDLTRRVFSDFDRGTVLSLSQQLKKVDNVNVSEGKHPNRYYIGEAIDNTKGSIDYEKPLSKAERFLRGNEKDYFEIEEIMSETGIPGDVPKNSLGKKLSDKENIHSLRAGGGKTKYIFDPEGEPEELPKSERNPNAITREEYEKAFNALEGEEMGLKASDILEKIGLNVEHGAVRSLSSKLKYDENVEVNRGNSCVTPFTYKVNEE